MNDGIGDAAPRPHMQDQIDDWGNHSRNLNRLLLGLPFELLQVDAIHGAARELIRISWSLAQSAHKAKLRHAGLLDLRAALNEVLATGNSEFDSGINGFLAFQDSIPPLLRRAGREIDKIALAVGEPPLPASQPPAPPTASKTRHSARRPTGQPGARTPGRPSPEAIDAAAHQTLFDALGAATEHGGAFIPTREKLAEAVSKELGIELVVEALFGSKRSGDPRYPRFMALWRQTQLASKDARRKRASGE